MSAESPAKAPRPFTKEEIRARTREGASAIDKTFREKAADGIIAASKNPAAYTAMVHEGVQKRTARYRDLAKRCEETLGEGSAIRTDMMASLEADEKWANITPTIEKMLDSLCSGIDEDGKLQPGSILRIASRFQKKNEEGESEKGYRYGVNLNRVREMREGISGLAAIVQQSPAGPDRDNVLTGLAAMEHAVDEYAHYDTSPTYSADAVMNMQDNQRVSTTAKGLATMGSIGFFVMASLAATVTGITCIARKGEGKFAPLFYAAVAGLAMPNVRKAIFEGKLEKQLGKAADMAKAESMEAMIKEYKVGGEEWGKVVKAIYRQGDAKKIAAVDNIRGLMKKGERKKAVTLAENLIDKHESRSEYDQLVRMIESTDTVKNFDAFAEQLSSVNSGTGRKLVLEYVEDGTVAI